jgi:hypothetical protein
MRRKIFLMLTIALSAFVFSTTALAQQKFTASLNSLQEVPVNSSAGRGSCIITLNTAETQITVNCSYSGLTSNVNASHIHGNAAPGVNAPVRFPLTNTGGTSGTITNTIAVTPADVAAMRSKLFYVNIHTANFGGGEIRGQVKISTTPFDLDGDGRTDIAVFRQSANTIFTLSSLNNSISETRFGSGTGDNWFTSHPSDYDGDGRADPLLLKLNQTSGDAFWSVLQTATNSIRTVQWGNFLTTTADSLAMGDYDGDAKQDFAVFRRSTGIWYILESSTNTGRVVQGFGAVNDFPSVGDYDGDGKTDLCVVRVESGQRIWYILNSSNGQSRRVPWGSSATDSLNFFAVVDVDGDGKQDIMVFRTIDGQRVFFALRSSDNQPYVLTWGVSTGVAATSDTNLFGDYDGDGKTDFVARRIVSGQLVWYIFNSSTQQGRAVTFGTSTDTRFAEPEGLPVSSNDISAF